MKKGLITISLAILLMVQNGFAQYSPKHFNRGSIQTVSGEITEVFSDKGYHYQDFVYINLSVKDGGTIKIEMAPHWFIPVEFSQKDHVTVTGSKVEVDKKTVIIAQSIQTEEKTILLRDKYGFPLWRGRGKGHGRRRHRGGRSKGYH
jgi:hypothetical protein